MSIKEGNLLLSALGMAKIPYFVFLLYARLILDSPTSKCDPSGHFYG